MTPPLRLLLRLDLRRFADAFRHPRPGAWAGVLIPAAVIVGGLWLAGEQARPDLSDGQGRLMLGMLAASPIAFQTYPILFRPADDALLRRLGIPPRALFAHRALRLAALSAMAVLALMIPFASTGEPLGVPLAIAAGAALVGWGTSLWSHARAADRTVDTSVKTPITSRLMGFDRELVAAGALVYAPILPVVLAGFAGAFAVGDGAGSTAVRLAVMAAVALACVPVALRRFTRALPRFGPHGGELAYAPPPESAGSELVVGRGLPALLPRRAGAVRARDAVVVGRRFRWAGRLVWPLAVVSVLALLRAGREPEVRGWVAAACVALLAAQGVAVIALGRLERGRLRWIDRASGLRQTDRFLGRWATSFGLALGVVIPVALAWALVAPGAAAWGWIAGAALGAVVVSVASLAAAGR